MNVDFAKMDFNNLSTIELDKIHSIANATITQYDITWEDEEGVHYVLLIPEGNELDYFDGVRIEIRRRVVKQTNDNLRKVFSMMLGIPMQNILSVQRHENKPFIHLHVRGKPDSEIITVEI